MQDARSHDGIGTGPKHSGRIWAGWVLGVLTVIPVVLLVMVAYGFATNVYIDQEVAVGWILIGFLAPVAVFMGLFAAELVRSGRSGSRIDRVFARGVAVAVLGASLVPVIQELIPGDDGRNLAIAVGGVGFVMMGYGVIRTPGRAGRATW